MDLDVTLLFQFAILTALVAVLSRWLFKPMLTVIEARHQKIHGTRDDVDRLERLSSADREAYDIRLREVRRTTQLAREQARLSGRDEARRILAETRASIAKAMNETREQVAASERAAQKTLEADVDSLAKQLVSKLLGREAA